MIKESCNLIGQYHILGKSLKVYDKKTLFPAGIQLIFHSELLIMWPNQP